MKEHFTQYLISIGFTPFRLVDGEYVENKINDYSTMQKGGLDIRYKKDNIEIIYGLNEAGKPPTLISPRPKIRVKVENKSNENEIHSSDYIHQYSDDAMNICLKEECNEDIFKAMFDNSIIFEYNKTKNYEKQRRI